MTTVGTRAERIAELEGFNLVVRLGQDPVSLDANGLLGPYDYKTASRSSWTVKEWREKRFQATYDGFTCDVLMADGKPAKPKVTLEVVRASYA